MLDTKASLIRKALLDEGVLINCPLCKYCGEVIGLIDIEGKPISSFVHCPRCGYNTTIKTDLERARRSVKDAKMFDFLEYPSDMPAREVFNKRVEWARMSIDSDAASRKAWDIEISLLENTRLDIPRLDIQIKDLENAIQSARDPVDRDRMNFERMILWRIKAVMQRQNQS
jgi:hypothetical protein